MLARLVIQNVVLIERLELSFSKGLAVFTGETGAGKSILLDSLSLALGERADTALVRQGAECACVRADFEVPTGHPARHLLAESGIDTDGDVVLKRLVYADGRSKAFINAEPVTVSFLKKVGALLAEINTQFASQNLLDSTQHLVLLDAYAADEEARKKCALAFEQWQSLLSALKNARQQNEELKKEEFFLADAVAVLTTLNPRPGEEEKLSEKRRILMNGEKIITSLQAVSECLGAEEVGAEALLSRAFRQLENADRLSEGAFSDLLETLSQAQASLADVLADLSLKSEEWSDVSQLPEIDERLFALQDAARRYHTQPDSLADLKVEFETKLAHIEHADEQIACLEKEVRAALTNYEKAALDLSDARKKAARQLDAAVQAELPDLKLGGAVFQTHIEVMPIEQGNVHGVDRVVFLISANNGQAPAPVHKAASGGELARFMLAVKLNLAQSSPAVTFVFDEVDSGVGGATADAVGKRLALLGQMKQTLVVTHSPQVASYGQTHFRVAKEEADINMITRVLELNETDRLREIARMLSGAKVTRSAEVAAGELLEKCKKTLSN